MSVNVGNDAWATALHSPQNVSDAEDNVFANQVQGVTASVTNSSGEQSSDSSSNAADEEQGVTFAHDKDSFVLEKRLARDGFLKTDAQDLDLRPEGEEAIMTLSPTDLEVLQQLSDIYQEGMEQNQIGYMARYQSIKKFAIGSVTGIMVLQILGIIYLIHGEAQMILEDAVLFSTYTITSAGFGSVKIPHTSSFLMFVVVYLFVGITFLAVVVAQTYQFWMFRKDRVKHQIDKVDGARLGLQRLKEMTDYDDSMENVLDKWPDPVSLTLRKELVKSLSTVASPSSTTGRKRWNEDNKIQLYLRHFSRFLRTTELGNFIKVSFWLALPLLIMTIGMMILEGWSYVQGLYFSTFCMFTVGYGDYYPTWTASKWFASVMLPCNILFVGLYLSNVAHYFVLLSNWNILRIQTKYQQNKHHDDIKVSRWRHLIDNNTQKIDVLVDPVSTDSEHQNVNIDFDDIEANVVEGDKSSIQPQQNDAARRQRRQRVKELSNLSAMLMEQEEFEKEQDVGDTTAVTSSDESPNDNSGVVAGKDHSAAPFQTMADMIERVKQKAEEAARNVEASHSRSDNDRHKESLKESDRSFSSGHEKDCRHTIDSSLTISELSNAQVFGREIERSTLLDSAFKGHQHQSKLQQAAKELLSMSSSGELAGSIANKSGPPSFVTRVLVQERLAYIIAHDVAGFDCDDCEVKQQQQQQVVGWSLLLSKKFLIDVANKRLIPPLARSAFFSMAMEALFFVGEHRLLVEGPKALLESLTPQEYAALTNPFLVAMGDDASVWTSWLASTQTVVTEYYQKNKEETKQSEHQNKPSVLASTSGVRSFRGGTPQMLRVSSTVWHESFRNLLVNNEETVLVRRRSTRRGKPPRRILKKDEPVDDYFPPNQGNATLLEHRSNM